MKLATGGETGFLVPHDGAVDLNDPENAGPYFRTCIPMNSIWDALEASSAKLSLVLADACFSGLLASTRNAVEPVAPGALARLARIRAMQVLTAGGAGEEAIEDQKLGHGRFTYKLLEELRAHAKAPLPPGAMVQGQATMGFARQPPTEVAARPAPRARCRAQDIRQAAARR